jgi:predicted dehydrogenase
MSNQQDGSFSRRGFLGTAGAVVGAGLALNAAACAAKGGRKASAGNDKLIKAAPITELRDPNAPVRVGIIGTGGMGTGHAVALTRVGESGKSKVQVVALSDACTLHMESCRDQCQKAGAKHEIGLHQDYRKLLARDDIHGVLIASPEHWHAKMGMDAMAAGKDVYLEKPMTLRLDEALQLYRNVNANPQIMFQVGTQMMRLPRYHEARRLIKEGAVGPISFSQTSYCRNSKIGEWNYYALNDKWEPGKNVDWDAWCGPAGPRKWDPLVMARWRRYRDFSTGIVGDLLVHVMTPLMLAIDQGWPTRVVGTGAHILDKAMENHDLTQLQVQFETGHTMIVAGSTCNELGLETVIRGQKGNIFLGGRHCVIRPEREYAEEVEERTVECPDIGNDQEQHRLGWLDSIRTRVPPPSSVELGAKVMVAVDLATRSMWDGHAYTFDPKTMTAARV